MLGDGAKEGEFGSRRGGWTKRNVYKTCVKKPLTEIGFIYGGC